MFLMKVESLMPDLQNLWSEVKLFLLSEETLPVLLISKAVTVVLMCVMSVAKCVKDEGKVLLQIDFQVFVFTLYR